MVEADRRMTRLGCLMNLGHQGRTIFHVGGTAIDTDFDLRPVIFRVVTLNAPMSPWQ